MQPAMGLFCLAGSGEVYEGIFHLRVEYTIIHISINYGIIAMQVSKKKYTIQESGSVTLPADFRKKYNLKTGDEISYIETEQGLLINARETLINKLSKEIGDDLRTNDVTLDELIASGRELRGGLLKELYGIDLDKE